MADGLCKYMDEIGSVCYDKAQIRIHPMALRYRDKDGDMKVTSFVGLSGIMAHLVPNYAVIKHYPFCDRLSKFSVLK